ncbi:MAG: HDOD domain-containing protein [Firmicutes bacterium]|nr:HDOD domain-containing protein [Bacillota bacterium]
MKKRLLVVDSDEQSLRQIQDALRFVDPDWEMTYVEGGPQGAEQLRTGHYDVLISALELKELDGGKLFELARELQPATLRVALNGPQDGDRLMQCLPLLHQALPRPFDVEAFLGMVDNAARLNDLRPELKDLLGHINSLPSVPKLYQELNDLLEGEFVNARQVGQLIGQDVAMAAKMLQLVNSAFFGLSREVEDLQQAVSFLGVDIIKALVLVQGVFDGTGELHTHRIKLTDLWHHSLTVARGSRALAAMEGLSRQVRSEAFMGGLLHDVGILVLAKHFPDRYDRVVEAATGGRLELARIEREEFGAGHPEVGAYLLGLWGLPSAMLMVAGYHHNPSEARLTAMNAVVTTHLADILCGVNHHPVFESMMFDNGVLDGLGLRERITGWRQVLAMPGW